MARKRRRRRGRLFVPRMKEGVPLLTVASNTLVGAAFSAVLTQEAWAVSMDATVMLHGFTAGEGPLIVGVAHSDYTDAEVEEWLEATASWDSGDMIAQEKARRKCRIIGSFSGVGVSEKMNDGNPKRIKLGWKIETSDTLRLWIYNEGAAALTTGAFVELTGPIYLRPM